MAKARRNTLHYSSMRVYVVWLIAATYKKRL